MNIRVVLVVLVLLTAVGVATANPLPDGGWYFHGVGWWPNMPGNLPCPQTCHQQVAVAETEAHPAPPITNTHTCKFKLDDHGPWFYGNNFTPTGFLQLCQSVDSAGTPVTSPVFKCLCVQ